ncbi:TIGR04282 family arsenosugar biosynthesis glycosyltransferase [Rasiella sp. SM2506]|uniref:TIGR04282 family arsenosugar biosynthesis glycosyltransferase n=1 Tax=Rasiella sp. SM2506 TaxID=3423914 RepID=UPI003D7BAAC5
MPILGLKNTENKDNGKEVFHFPSSKNALIIFTRNPELGKCKTRLAATIGNEAALEIYKFLIVHTVKISTEVIADKFVYYSEERRKNDYWNDATFSKKTQHGSDLGIRMENAFNEVFALGYERAIIIGSDMYDITAAAIDEAFRKLASNNFVLGPAEDGGYYLLGMKTIQPDIFRNKKWGTETVQKETLADLKDESVALLAEKNDVDYYEDIMDIEVFQQFLPNTIKK